MNGERLVVEEVCGASHYLQAVDEVEASLLAIQVDGEHGARCLAKLSA